VDLFSTFGIITHLRQKEQNEEAKDFEKSINSKDPLVHLLLLRKVSL
jgi:hypothetical protein